MGRRIRTKISIKKKLFLNIILILCFCIGTGYSVLRLSMGINGNIEVAKLKVTCEAGKYLMLIEVNLLMLVLIMN